MENLIDPLLSAIAQAQACRIENELIFSDTSVTGPHEFLFFIKPEITVEDSAIRTEAILQMIFAKVQESGLAVKTVRVQSAAYLDRHDIIAQHYGVINQLSRDAKGTLSADAREKFASLFGISIEDAAVLGSLEFLDAYPHFNPRSLDYLWQNTKAEKLAGGTYAAPLTIDGTAVYLVNGFHPRQLEHFTQPGRSIVVCSLVGEIAWTAARNELIGKTNPAAAAPGSIRRELLENQEAFGLPAVTASWNGVHLSAGPLEGLVELIRYQSDFSSENRLGPNDFSFGQALLSSLGAEQTTHLLTNPNLMVDGAEVSAFDLTEECDAAEALSRLQAAQAN